MNKWKEFLSKFGYDIGEPMDQLPVFTPQSGIGQGEPIYDCPGVDFSFWMGGAVGGLRVVKVKCLGLQDFAWETAPGSNVFVDGGDWIGLTLLEPPLDDPDVQEHASVIFSYPYYGITNALYTCTETAADSSYFENDLHGIVFAKNPLTGKAQLDISTMYFMDDAELIETATGSGVYTNENYSVWMQQVYKHPNYITRLGVSDGVALSNALFSVWEAQPNVYRNYHPAIPTDLSADDLAMPDFVAWQLKIGGITDTSLVSQVTITTPVDNTNQVTFSVVKGSLLSDQKFILIPDRTLEAPPPQGYVPLKIDDTTIRWQDEETREVKAKVEWVATRGTPDPTEIDAKPKPGAVVLRSLNWEAKMLQFTDPSSRIANRLKAMGYTVVQDNQATVGKTLDEYILGKQIWYSLSHGVPAFGLPAGTFLGLKFLEEGEITADIIPPGLNYRLVMVDGCCSASTGEPNQTAALGNTNVSFTVKSFADKFGGDVAYTGWAWSMYAGWAQYYTGEFLEQLKYNKSTGVARTVEQAHQEFLKIHKGKKHDPQLMRIYGKKDNIIDVRAKNFGQ